MSSHITCPSCGHEFEPNDLIRGEVEKELRVKAEEWKKKKEKEFAEEKDRFRQEAEDSIRKRIVSDFENKLRFLESNNKENEEKLNDAREKEMVFLKRELELKNKEQEIELSIQRRINEEKEKLSDEIRKLESQKSQAKETESQLKIRELEKQLVDQRKMAEEMQRKAEQGSMQLQGEVQELALEDLLRTIFPFDLISEVGKGVKGADCVQTVRNNHGQECGKIVYESKRTTSFSAEWIQKLKLDTRTLNADIAVIVTRSMPKDMDGFGIKDGVWICNFSEVKSLAAVLRDGVIRVYNSGRVQLNKGDKMNHLYDYLTSNEFAQQWNGIREGFIAIRSSIQKERESMERIWKSREKQLERVLLNANHIHGSIEGIAGDIININLLENDHPEELPG